MSEPQTRISAYISESTRAEVDRYIEEHGVKKGSLVEAALLHHLQALRELPADVIIPARIVVTKASAKAVAARVGSPNAPTAAMNALFGKRRRK